MTNSYLLLSFLILGHVFCDFYLQPKEWVKSRNEKHRKSLELFFHALIHGVVTFLIVFIYTRDCSFSSTSPILIIPITHYIIDLLKSYLRSNSYLYFILDQILHVTILYIFWIYLSSEKGVVETLLSYVNLFDYKMVIVVMAYLIVMKPVSIFISILLSQWSCTSDDINTTEDVNLSSENIDTVEEDELVSENDTLLAAGDMIGKIERMLILTFILCNQFSGVGFLLAAKSIFRFGDLTKSKDKKLTEYVMVGTLASVAISIFIGLAAGYLAEILPYK